MKDINAIIAKHEAPAAAEPAPEASSAPPAGASEAGSAAADGGVSVAPSADTSSPAAPNHDVLEAKLARDREARRLKDQRRATARKEQEAEKARRAAEEEREKWSKLGKDQKWIDAIKAAGRDPREVYEEMRQEALRSGTPDARIDALAKELSEEKAARAREREQSEKARLEREEKEAAAANDRAFATDFQRGLGEAKFAPLLEEYEPEQLFSIANTLRHDPRRLFTAADSLNVSLTGRNGTFTMLDILNVMHATQAAHRARLQRRTQNAASQTSQGAQTQAPQANPTVNGTVERKAGTATNASAEEAEREQLRKMSKHERREYLAKKYP